MGTKSGVTLLAPTRKSEWTIAPLVSRSMGTVFYPELENSSLWKKFFLDF